MELAVGGTYGYQKKLRDIDYRQQIAVAACLSVAQTQKYSALAYPTRTLHKNQATRTWRSLKRRSSRFPVFPVGGIVCAAASKKWVPEKKIALQGIEN